MSSKEEAASPLFSLNQCASQALLEQAHLMELKGESFFKSRAYHKAAQVLSELARPYDEISKEGPLTDLPGIGKAISENLQSFLEHRTWKELDELRQEIPPSLIEVNGVPGLGAKKCLQLYRDLGVRDLLTLRDALADGRVAALKGFTEKTAAKLSVEVDRLLRTPKTFRKDSLEELGRALVSAFASGCIECHLVGAARRKEPQAENLEVLLVGDDLDELRQNLVFRIRATKLEMCESSEPLTVLHPSGCPVVFHLSPSPLRGRLLLETTGPEEYCDFLRASISSDSSLDLGSEEELLKGLGLPWLPPEVRHQKRAWTESPKEILSLEAIGGNLHAHTTASDGRNSLEEMVAEAVRRGHRFFGVTDHSRSLTVAGGLSVESLLRQVEDVRSLQEQRSEITLLAASECDVLEDGALDYPDEVLQRLDYVVAAVHSHFQLDPDKMTERICRAVRHPKVKILAHPTGRVITRRPGYQAEWQRVFQTCADHGVAVEINASPWRLDLSEELLKQALDCGCHIAINTDAHSVAEFEVLTHGVDMGRRALLHPEVVINTWATDRLCSWLRGEG